MDIRRRPEWTTSSVRTKTLTRFPTNGSTTEPELWWQVDLDLEPRGTQSTISARARGDVVVGFGNMRHPPFDADAARNELRLALNAIDGVDIPESQLGGWPTFPLAVLEDLANLVHLVAVLDRIAAESHTSWPVEKARPEGAGDPATTIEPREPAITGG